MTLLFNKKTMQFIAIKVYVDILDINTYLHYENSKGFDSRETTWYKVSLLMLCY